MYKFGFVILSAVLFAFVIARPQQQQQQPQQQIQATSAVASSSSSSSQQQQSSSSSSSTQQSAQQSSSQHQNSSASSSSGTSTTPATIIKELNVNNPDGSYNSSYETSNGIKVENAGFMKKILIPKGETADGQVIEEHEELVLVQMGSYTYPDPEGNLITLRYIADENGFQPQGDHLPTPPQ